MNDIGDRRGLLDSFDDWEDDVRARYPEENGEQSKPAADYRNFDQPARETVREFYRLNHTHQTLEFARANVELLGEVDQLGAGVMTDHTVSGHDNRVLGGGDDTRGLLDLALWRRRRTRTLHL